MDCVVHGVTKSQTQLSDFQKKKEPGTLIQQKERGDPPLLIVHGQGAARWGYILINPF